MADGALPRLPEPPRISASRPALCRDACERAAVRVTDGRKASGGMGVVYMTGDGGLDWGIWKDGGNTPEVDVTACDVG